MVSRIIFIIILVMIIISFYNDLEQFFMFRVLSNKVINLNQAYGHLGDHIFNTYYFNFIKDYIEENDIIINYYFKKEYHYQTKEFLLSKNIIFHDYKPIGSNLGVGNLYFNDNFLMNYFVTNFFTQNYKIAYNVIYPSIFNEVSSLLKIPLRMDKLEYDNTNLLVEYDKLIDDYKNIDILIINSSPKTTQYNLDHNEWNEYIYKLKEHNFKIVTTQKVEGIPCTVDHNLTVFKIAAISTHSKIIIAINTGPTSSIFNKYTLEYTKYIYIFDNRVTFTLPIIRHKENINDIDINELISTIGTI